MDGQQAGSLNRIAIISVSIVVFIKLNGSLIGAGVLRCRYGNGYGYIGLLIDFEIGEGGA